MASRWQVGKDKQLGGTQSVKLARFKVVRFHLLCFGNGIAYKYALHLTKKEITQAKNKSLFMLMIEYVC